MEAFAMACTAIVDAPVRKVAVICDSYKFSTLEKHVPACDFFLWPRRLGLGEWYLSVVSLDSNAYTLFQIAFGKSFIQSYEEEPPVVPRYYKVKVFTIPTDKKESTGLSVCRTIVKILCMERLDNASLTKFLNDAVATAKKTPRGAKSSTLSFRLDNVIEFDYPSALKSFAHSYRLNNGFECDGDQWNDIRLSSSQINNRLDQGQMSFGPHHGMGPYVYSDGNDSADEGDVINYIGCFPCGIRAWESQRGWKVEESRHRRSWLAIQRDYCYTLETQQQVGYWKGKHYSFFVF
jgi:hypothetical protein